MTGRSYFPHDSTIDLRNIATLGQEILDDVDDDGKPQYDAADSATLAVITDLAYQVTDYDKADGSQAAIDALKEHGDNQEATLIADDYFEEYAQELAEECGDLPREPKWPFNCIDWEEAAKELLNDYVGITFDGHSYWIKAS